MSDSNVVSLGKVAFPQPTARSRDTLEVLAR
jgi:hypothetical protein